MGGPELVLAHSLGSHSLGAQTLGTTGVPWGSPLPGGHSPSGPCSGGGTEESKKVPPSH